MRIFPRRTWWGPVLLLAFGAAAAQAAPQSSIENYGLTFPGRGLATRANPASLLEQGRFELSGFAAHEDTLNSLHAAVNASVQSAGLGAFFSRESDGNVTTDLGLAFAVFGVKLGMSYVGLSEFDLGMHLDSGSMRYSFAARDLGNGIQALDAGLAYRLSGGILGIDLRKAKPFGSGELRLAPSVAVGSQNLFLAVNYRTGTSSPGNGTVGAVLGGHTGRLGLRLLLNSESLATEMKSLAASVHYEL